MTNTSMLKACIEEKGLKNKFLASACGITERTFYNKVNGRTPFVQDEILVLRNLLGLDEKQNDGIFFAPEGDDSSPISEEG